MDWGTEKIGLRISELRKQFKKTSVELSEAIQISQPYLSRIENGDLAVPIEVLIKICSIFNITLSEFFSEELNLDVNIKNLVISAEKLNKEQIEALQNFLDTLNIK
ncbi:helix-turn-helix transcriptional regulator [Bacillus sp. ISL-39]|uniref:helix-turn-helix domain-containing protein n=1 Tax=Bacillus sp. ISL-39 TaxID=2819124 RepID=UPI001BE4F09C|nr:helix-turn-helix transcriptional regulator [Bacillus sp. ISL-39]MBT2636570.1 helix-turn-helix transcriptional regulator [Bacillus sp. ISL-39]